MNKFNDFSNFIQKDTCFNIEDIPDSEYLQVEAYRILSNDEDNLKPFSIINIKSIENKKEFELLLSHLINHDTRIREAVSFILNEINNEKFLAFFNDENSLKIIVQGLLDINPNVVRNVIDFIKNSKYLKEKFKPLIIKKTEEILEELSKFLNAKFKENSEKSNKNHAKNKYTFNLYWLLEAMAYLDVDNNEEIENILTKTSDFLDYTIREKTALVLSKMENPPSKLLRKLKNDVNIYVKNQLLC